MQKKILVFFILHYYKVLTHSIKKIFNYYWICAHIQIFFFYNCFSIYNTTKMLVSIRFKIDYKILLIISFTKNVNISYNIIINNKY
jgi:hypothetical protein